MLEIFDPESDTAMEDMLNPQFDDLAAEFNYAGGD